MKVMEYYYNTYYTLVPVEGRGPPARRHVGRVCPQAAPHELQLRQDRYSAYWWVDEGWKYMKYHIIPHFYVFSYLLAVARYFVCVDSPLQRGFVLSQIIDYRVPDFITNGSDILS